MKEKLWVININDIDQIKVIFVLFGFILTKSLLIGGKDCIIDDKDSFSFPYFSFMYKKLPNFDSSNIEKP